MDASSPNPPLPVLHEAILSAEELVRLFDDLQRSAAIERVTIRSAGARRAESLAISLDEARTLFASGDAAAVQVRYEYDGAAWCDTILRTPGGARIVRMKQALDGPT